MKRLVDLVALFALLGVSIFTSCTYAVDAIDTSNPVHLVRESNTVGTYTGLSQAINEAESGDVINIMEDISVLEASVISGKSLIIKGNNHTITRDADITTLTVNEGAGLKLVDITITDNAVNFAPNRYDSLIRLHTHYIYFCTGGVIETMNESGEVISSVCDTTNVDVAKTHPQIYSEGDIYGDNLTISNSLNSNGSAAIIVEKGGIEMINSNFIHNGASGTSNAGRGGAIRVGPNSATNIADESPITKILFSGCLFENNYGRNHGGALSLQYMPEIVTIDNCIFSGNTAYLNGGAIHIPNIRSNPTGYLPALADNSLFPIGTLYVNNSDFYNNWAGNDGSAIENDDLFLEISSSNFEHNYGTWPENQSVGVVSCQAGGGDDGRVIRPGRGQIFRRYVINNSNFRDTNTCVFGDHDWIGGFFVDNSSFENQKYVILTRQGIGEIKNSMIKNSSVQCGNTGGFVYDFNVITYNDYLPVRIPLFGESTFRLENNIYSNDCTTNEYFPVRNVNYTTGENNITIENEDNTKVFVHRSYYDSANIQGTDEIYYGATMDDGRYAYIKKDKFYNFDEFNAELGKLSYGNSGYELGSGKTMLFYLDDGYTELWSGSISTTTNLYGKETDIHNIIYEGMDGVDFERITHTYKFNNLNHTQYLTELTPYVLNIPTRNGYEFEGWYLDEEYVEGITSIEEGSTGDIRVYAKWTKKQGGYSGGGGHRVEPGDGEKSQEDVDDPLIDSYNSEESETEEGGYPEEFEKAYEFAYKNGITTMDTIESADMEGSLSRIAMAKMLSKYAVNILGMKPDETRNNKFRDVTDELDMEYDNGVTLAYQLGIMGINMKDNKFRPYDLVSRGEFVTALSRMVYHTLDGEYESTARYYTNHIATLEEKGIISNVKPDMQELRGYVMIMLMRSAM